MLLSALSDFKCCLDNDIESFLHNKAYDFTLRKWSSTYLIVDADDFEQGRLKIEGYYTLSHKSVYGTENISKNRLRAINGGKDADSIQFILIGQIGKFYDVDDDGEYISSALSLEDILKATFTTIQTAIELIPSRYALVECNDTIMRKGLYEKYGFSYLRKSGDLHQYIRKL